jgi:uncharacterized protein involved in response to NO
MGLCQPAAARRPNLPRLHLATCGCRRTAGPRLARTPSRASARAVRCSKRCRHVPLWASAFRPFYLLGSAYAPLLAAAWLAAWFGLLPTPGGMPLKLLHGHEFIFGFATAIILGIVVTALPSWAGTDEVHGARLAVLVALWLAGRVAFWASPWLPAPLPALVDGLLYPAVMGMLAPQLLRVKNRLYLLLLPILFVLFVANLLYYQARGPGAMPASPRWRCAPRSGPSSCSMC